MEVCCVLILLHLRKEADLIDLIYRHLEYHVSLDGLPAVTYNGNVDPAVGYLYQRMFSFLSFSRSNSTRSGQTAEPTLNILLRIQSSSSVLRDLQKVLIRSPSSTRLWEHGSISTALLCPCSFV
jgi:hypothetical protein